MDRDEQPQGQLIADSDILVRHPIADYLRTLRGLTIRKSWSAAFAGFA